MLPNLKREAEGDVEAHARLVELEPDLGQLVLVLLELTPAAIEP